VNIKQVIFDQTMPISGLFSHTFSQPAFAGMYALADIVREEMDLPIPEYPHTGFVPRREILHSLPRLSRQDESDERCDAEYHADDEMSDYLRPQPSDYGTDVSDATRHEERYGMTEQHLEDRSAISTFSYYYYHDPTYEQPTRLLRVSNFALRAFLNMVESIPLTSAESWVRCKSWRYQVAKATALQNNLSSSEDNPLHSTVQSPKVLHFSVFQILHDQPVDAVDKMKAVSAWRGTISRNSFGSMPSAPPSMISYLARRRSSLASFAKVRSLDPDVDSTIVGKPLTSPTRQAADIKCLTVIPDDDESRSGRGTVKLPPSQPAKPTEPEATGDTLLPTELQTTTVEATRTRCANGDDSAAGEQYVSAGQIGSVVNDAQGVAIDSHSTDQLDQQALIKAREVTPQMIRSMISILTAPSADIKRLTTFWEEQK
jgi:hypothetical protein